MRNRAILGTLVFTSFAVYSALRSPVPGVNEPHYLAKAKHFWQPDWCRGDLFLESSNPHLVFYYTFGRLAHWFPLAQAAWIGRAIGLALLAFGWSRFLRKLVPTSRAALWATWLYLALAACGNFSGEWIIGGIEAKVIAYGLDFLALAFVLEHRWTAAALCGGLAVSFHPVVGLWIAICSFFASVFVLAVPCPVSPADSEARHRPATFAPATMRQAGPATAAFVLGSLPG
ncbi:MAG TPA: hypothetical protein EYP14_16915, partial [Planctomycetaceae bacterium]|nr:hypothetical protein [Planctomycetaceae bacterium]